MLFFGVAVRRPGCRGWAVGVTGSYDLTLENNNKAYASKAEVTSIDSVHWEITSLSITHQTDSISKHFEETLTWKYPVTLNRYNVHLRITDQ